jgi:hypothetical protein
MPIRKVNRHRYPPDWPKLSEHIRFVRAQGQCECEGECGIGHLGRCPNRHGWPAFRTQSTVILTTAHLDHIPEHCDPDNLRAMCQACHLAYDAEHHAQTRLHTREVELLAAGQEYLPLDVDP